MVCFQPCLKSSAAPKMFSFVIIVYLAQLISPQKIVACKKVGFDFVCPEHLPQGVCDLRRMACCTSNRNS